MPPTPTILEEHRTPDGLLHLVITRDHTGDITIEFRGYPWHTRADIEAATRGLPEPQAVRAFVSKLLEDRSIIAIERVGNAVTDVWPSADPDRDLRGRLPGATIEFRRWSRSGPSR